MQRSGIHELLSSPARGLQALTLGALLFTSLTPWQPSPSLLPLTFTSFLSYFS